MRGYDITPRMRAVLIDWLIQIHSLLELQLETLYLTVALLDRFLQVRATYICFIFSWVLPLFFANRFFLISCCVLNTGSAGFTKEAPACWCHCHAARLKVRVEKMRPKGPGVGLTHRQRLHTRSDKSDGAGDAEGARL